jgi:probable HAF family extracellular repeat protein
MTGCIGVLESRDEGGGSMNRGTVVLLLASFGSVTLAHSEAEAQQSAAQQSAAVHNQSRHAGAKFFESSLSANGPLGSTNAINDFGVVAGTIPAVTPQYFSHHAALWIRGKVTDLGTLGGIYSTANALNNRGEVAGTADDSNEAPLPFTWSRGAMRAVPGVAKGYGLGVNDFGQVVGISFGADWFARAFVFDGQNLSYVTADPSVYSEARAINNRGQVVGSMQTSSGTRAYIWERGVLTELPSLGGNDDAAFAINDWGDVVGKSSDGAVAHAVLWNRHGVVDLGVNELFGEGTYSIALAINNRREIVGVNDVTEPIMGHTRAFYYHAGRPSILNSITVNNTMLINQPVGINDFGIIAGNGGPTFDEWLPWLWFPIP